MPQKYLRSVAVALCASALLVTGCGSDTDAAETATTTTAAQTTTTAPADLAITDAWARKSPAGTSIGAVYLTVTSATADRLVGASVPAAVAKTTELHETTVAGDGEAMGASTTTMGTASDQTTMTAPGDDGAMTMKPVKAIDLPAGTAVKLEPGGFHIMLIDLVSPLQVGDRIEVTLSFEKAADQVVEAEVREA